MPAGLISAHMVRENDLIWLSGRWNKVVDAAPEITPGTTSLAIEDAADTGRITVEPRVLRLIYDSKERILTMRRGPQVASNAARREWARREDSR